MVALYIPTRWVLTEADVSDDPDVFPLIPGMMFVTKKSPTFNTSIQTMISGREVGKANWSSPRWAFQVQYEFIRSRPTQPDLMKLFGFFSTRLGRFAAFYYSDPSDNTVSGDVIGTGDGTTTTFQFARLLGGTTYGVLEPIYVLNGTPTVTINGTPSSDFTVGSYGSLVFGTPPPAGAVIAWSGQFMFLCRFDQDNLDAAQMVKDLWSNNGLNFISRKP